MLGLNIEWRSGRSRGCHAGLLMCFIETRGSLVTYGKGVGSWVGLYFQLSRVKPSRPRLGISKPKPTQAVTSLRRQPRTSPSGHDASGLELQSGYVANWFKRRNI